MISKYRLAFNSQFTEEKYSDFKKDIASDFDYEPNFRIAETPFFISKELKAQLIEGCNELISIIKKKDFKAITEKALNSNKILNENSHTNFLSIDFGICKENGLIVPKLIEVQGFPSLFNFQNNCYKKFVTQYPFLKKFTPFLNSLNEEEYLKRLEDVICNKHSKKNVILLEIEPEKQNTKIDFYYCKRDLGVASVCITQIIKKGKQLFYIDQKGHEVQIKRIYNRVVFDELDKRTDLKLNFSFADDMDVEWAGHPNWFFRISKFILPYLKGPYFIETSLLSEVEKIPEDLENYVLKPLFSFSGNGVIYNVTKKDIDAVKDKELYILQKKVPYAAVIQAPDSKVKVEIRILCTWKDLDDSPCLVANLVRLSKGEMIGPKYNQNKDWVVGSIGLFEK